MKIVTINELRFLIRNDADLRVCKEILEKNTYQKTKLGFSIKPKEVWIDCGCNIGVFAVWAEKVKGAIVYGFEACEENAQIANYNLQLNKCKSKIFTGFIKSVGTGTSKIVFNERTPARSSPFSKGVMRCVPNYSLNEAISKYKPNGLKIDIEGGEFDLLDNGINVNGLNSLVIEYHFLFNKDTKLARKRIKPLMESFKNNSIHKNVLEQDQWNSWQDSVFYFWN